MTDLKSRTFLAGESDIDLVLIVRNFNSPEFINFAEQFSKATKMIYYFLPFFKHMPVFNNQTLKDVNRYLSLEAPRKNKDFRNWIFLWGEDKIKRLILPSHQEVSPTVVRFSYEALILEICRFKWEPGRPLRRAYANFFEIMRQSFISVKKRDAQDNNEYVFYMKEIGLPPKFIDFYLKLPSLNFQRHYEFLPLTLFSALRLMENIKEPSRHHFSNPDIVVEKKIEVIPAEEAMDFVRRIDKTSISSVYCGQYIHCYPDYQNLYIILRDDLPYEVFQKEFNNIYDKLDFLPTLKINSKLGMPKAAEYDKSVAKEIFPLILTKKLLYLPYLLNGLWGLECLDVGLFGKKIFGEEVDFLRIQNGDYNQGLLKQEHHSLVTLAVTIYQIFLNEKVRNEAFGRIRETIKFYQLFEKTNTIYYGDINRRYREVFGHDGPDINNIAEFSKATEIFYQFEKKRISS
ncbi:MAG: hypothetical protein Q7K65_04160 [Candidatus Buchananbacteria bacterium]|nr:hypothetical protein [Candidatus Buchananbacteria bacterium]